MNKDRKILLIILYIMILLSISVMNVIIKNEKRVDLLNRITLTEQKLMKLNKVVASVTTNDVADYLNLLENEKERYFDGEDSDPYKFGIEIKDLLENQHLIVKSYKTIESDNTFLIEFSIEGSSYDFFAFMRTLYEKNKNYTFPFCSLKNKNTGINADFRIGYAIYD